MQDLSSFLHDAKIFSKIDLTKGYYQVPLEEADIPKTAIITPFGLFKFLFMPFGLPESSNASLTPFPLLSFCVHLLR